MSEENKKEEAQAPDQIEPLKPEPPQVEHPAPVIEAPETQEADQEFRRDAHTGPGSKFQGSPPAEVVPPNKKRSEVY